MFNTVNKYIFTHPMRCAGTSIELALRMLPSSYIIQHDEEIKENGKTGMYVPDVPYKHESLTTHLDYLSRIQQNINEYYIFTCIRNPWDRAVSMYYFDITFGIVEQMLFDDYIILKYNVKDEYNILSFNEFVYHNGEYMADEIIKFENLKEDFERVCKQLSIPVSDLQKICFHNKRPVKAYQDYYTNINTKNMVEEMGKETIELLKYKFN